MSARDADSAAGLPDRERLEQLLVDRATDGLDPDSWGELELLLESLPDEDPESWELAAAWVDVALIDAHEPEHEPLPQHLRHRVIAEGRLAVRSMRGRESGSSPDPRSAAAAPPKLRTPRADIAPSRPAPPAPATGLGWLGYAASAAAGIALTLIMTSKPSFDPERAYRDLVAKQADAREVPFESQVGTGVDGLVGSVVWSDAAQEGYLRLEGLPINDPREKQYQLWIVDPDVGPQPVDGGVFDIPTGGVRTIPIDAKLAVDRPTLFVITTERPGGVVVSDGPFQAVATFES